MNGKKIVYKVSVEVKSPVTGNWSVQTSKEMSFHDATQLFTNHNRSMAKNPTVWRNPQILQVEAKVK